VQSGLKQEEDKTEKSEGRSRKAGGLFIFLILPMSR
jgi:hypothetical protein